MIYYLAYVLVVANIAVHQHLTYQLFLMLELLLLRPQLYLLVVFYCHTVLVFYPRAKLLNHNLLKLYLLTQPLYFLLQLVLVFHQQLGVSLTILVH